MPKDPHPRHHSLGGFSPLHAHPRLELPAFPLDAEKLQELRQAVGPTVFEDVMEARKRAEQDWRERNPENHECYDRETCHEGCPAHRAWLARLEQGGSDRPSRRAPPSFNAPRSIAKVVEMAPMNAGPWDHFRETLDQFQEKFATAIAPLTDQGSHIPLRTITPFPKEPIGYALCDAEEGESVSVSFASIPFPKEPIALKPPAAPGHHVVVPCSRKHCGQTTVYPLGSIDPKEGRCSHIFEVDYHVGSRGAMVCKGCTLSIPLQVMADIPELDRHMNHRANAMADKLGTLTDDNQSLLAENATLRRKLEKLEKKK